MSRLTVWAFLCLSCGVCAADEPAPRVSVEKTASGAKIFRILTPVVVDGKWRKPVFYVLERTRVGFEPEELLPKEPLQAIRGATTRHPF